MTSVQRRMPNAIRRPVSANANEDTNRPTRIVNAVRAARRLTLYRDDVPF